MRSLLLPLALLTACSADQSGTLALFEGLGDHQHTITTTVPRAQAYFDQGLRLTYAFNHGEAISVLGRHDRSARPAGPASS